MEGTISAPLTETPGARVAGYYSRGDGWFRNIAKPVAGVTPGPAVDSYNAEAVFVRGTLAFASPDDATRITGKVAYGRRTRDGVGPTGGSQIVFSPAAEGRNDMQEITFIALFKIHEFSVSTILPGNCRLILDAIGCAGT